MKWILLLCLCLQGALYSRPAECAAFFSPRDHLADRLIELIHNEKKSIKVAVSTITHLGIVKALVEAKNRGVIVEVIIDPSAIRNSSSIRRLLEGKVPLFVWDRGTRYNKGRRKGVMHDKFCVFGERLIWTGSFNFTNEAHARHQENAVTIASKEIAGQFLNEFVHMKLYESSPYRDYLQIYPKKRGAKKTAKKVS